MSDEITNGHAADAGSDDGDLNTICLKCRAEQLAEESDEAQNISDFERR